MEWYRQGKTEVLTAKPFPVPLCLPLIPQSLAWFETPVSAVRCRLLIAWTVARTLKYLSMWWIVYTVQGNIIPLFAMQITFQQPIVHINCNQIAITLLQNLGARGSAVGWGTTLQVRRSRVRFPMVSLEFFIDIKPSGRTMALELTQPLTEMSTRNISWG